MEILAHRGIWRVPEEQNTLEAFRTSERNGFGVEIDIRRLDLNGTEYPYLSHDKCKSDDLPRVMHSSVLNALRRIDDSGNTIAINVKEPNCINLIYDDFKNFKNFFVFDIELACPDEFDEYVEVFGKRHVATRVSYDCRPIVKTDIVWLDPFIDSEIEVAIDFLKNEALDLCVGKKVYLASPDLHHKPGIVIPDNFSGICTDYPRFYKDFSHAQNLCCNTNL